MGYSELVLIVNAASIIILLIMAALLLVATKFKGENGYAAAIIVLPNVPIYIYNMSRCVGWYEITLFFFSISFSVNAMLMPLLWLFTLRNFNPDFRFRTGDMLHFLPAAFLLIIALSLPEIERMHTIVYETTGDDTWIGDVNSIVVFGQMIGYFIAIFLYLRRVRLNIGSNSSDAEYLHKEWIPKLMVLFAVLFVIVMIAYIIDPRTDAWLIQILNVIAMSFLVYNAIAHPVLNSMQRLPENMDGNDETGRKMDENEDDGVLNSSTFVLNEEQMKNICDKIVDYLQRTEAYRRNDLSLAILSMETGVTPKVISRSINTYLHRNFFELVNEMRIEEAKRLLLSPETSGFKIDSIYEECGFRTRSTFFLAFKKIEGKSPARWLQDAKSAGDI